MKSTDGAFRKWKAPFPYRKDFLKKLEVHGRRNGCNAVKYQRKGHDISIDELTFHMPLVNMNFKCAEVIFMRIVLSLLVDNTAGVLSRVSGMFSRRGYNIESLTVGVTADPRYSRMTVVSLGDNDVLEQIEKQLAKLEDVRDIKRLYDGQSVYRELILIKVKANAMERQSINAIADIFRAHIVDVGKDSLTVMMTGDQAKLDALLNLVEDYEILEVARTGITGLSRGSDDIRYLP